MRLFSLACVVSGSRTILSPFFLCFALDGRIPATFYNEPECSHDGTMTD